MLWAKNRCITGIQEGDWRVEPIRMPARAQIRAREPTRDRRGGGVTVPLPPPHTHTPPPPPAT